MFDSNLTEWLIKAEKTPKDNWDRHYIDGKKAVVLHPEFAKWSIAGFVSTTSPEGRKFRCDIYFDNIKVGEAVNRGWGQRDVVKIAGDASSRCSWRELCSACSVAGWGESEVESAVVDMLLIKGGKLI
jgi:hypothetical protein